MTNSKTVLISLLILVFSFAAAPRQVARAAQKADAPAPLVIPFELVTRHIMIRVRVNNSDPLWFIFDTGDKVAVIALERAKSLGLNLQGEVNVGGAGAGTVKGATVQGATVRVIGAEGTPQPVTMSIPLAALEPRFGHDIDGIIGADFIKQFVVEIDYAARVLRLHDKSRFVYSGSGEIIPLTFIFGGYPIIEANVTVPGRPPIKGKFVLDFGSGGSLALHRPFVEQQNLPTPTQKTIRAIGGGGVGGRTTGLSGRIETLKIGKFLIDSPLTLFSQDRGGAFANSEIQGNIGAVILSKFKVLLDYGRDRIILEPTASLSDPIAPASSGLRLIAEGSDHKTFRIEEFLENSPASEAGFAKDDVVVSVDGRPASELTLSSLYEALEKSVPHRFLVRRGTQTVELTVTPRRIV